MATLTQSKPKTSPAGGVTPDLDAIRAAAEPYRAIADPLTQELNRLTAAKVELKDIQRRADLVIDRFRLAQAAVLRDEPGAVSTYRKAEGEAKEATARREKAEQAFREKLERITDLEKQHAERRVELTDRIGEVALREHAKIVRRQAECLAELNELHHQDDDLHGAVAAALELHPKVSGRRGVTVFIRRFGAPHKDFGGGDSLLRRWVRECVNSGYEDLADLLEDEDWGR